MALGLEHACIQYTGGSGATEERVQASRDWKGNCMKTTGKLRRFSELRLGETRVSSARPVDGKEMIDFARRFDPQWFHIDAAAAELSPFDGLIASGIYTLALWRSMDHDMNGDIAFQCGAALEAVKFCAPVRAGDELVLRSNIAALRVSKSQQCGIVAIEYAMHNHSDQSVLTLSAINMVYL